MGHNTTQYTADYLEKLNKDLFRLSLSSRPSSLGMQDLPATEQSCLIDTVYLENKQTPYKRARLLLQTNPCSVKSCSMCPFPNAKNNLDDATVLKSFNNLISDLPTDVSMVTLYHNGNFFSNKEISKSLRKQLVIAMVSKFEKLEILCVECLPQMITWDHLVEIDAVIKETNKLQAKLELNISVGVQSSSQVVRQWSVLSPFKQKHLDDLTTLPERVAKELSCITLSLRYFIMYGTLFLDKTQILEDCLYSAIDLAKNNSYVNICPLSIQPNTLIKKAINLNNSFASCAPTTTDVAYLVYCLILLSKLSLVNIAYISITKNCDLLEHLDTTTHLEKIIKIETTLEIISLFNKKDLTKANALIKANVSQKQLDKLDLLVTTLLLKPNKIYDTSLINSIIPKVESLLSLFNNQIIAIKND